MSDTLLKIILAFSLIMVSIFYYQEKQENAQKVQELNLEIQQIQQDNMYCKSALDNCIKQGGF
jgi:hypothetical protein